MAKTTEFTNFATEHPNYFPGQYLLEEDFELQHKYLSDRQRYYNHSLHVSGIIEGLEVEVTQDKKSLLIKSGSAIDSKGNLVVSKVDITFSEFNNITSGELYIQYSQKQGVQQQENVDESYTRWIENPIFGFAATSPENGIKLAKLTISGDTITLDTNIREYSGLSLPNSNDKALTLRSGGNTNPNLAVLTGSLKIDGDLTVTGIISGKIDTENITSGILSVDRIPNLSADKITSGVLAVERISNLSADKITSGVLAVERIPNLSANKITSGSINGNINIKGSLTTQEGNVNLAGNQQIVFTDTGTTNKLKLQLWDGYGFGINGGTLFYTANGKHSWRDAESKERMLLTTGENGGLIVNGKGSSSFAGSLTVTGSLTVNTGGAYSWNKLVVTTTSEWGDGDNKYVTIGAGGAPGIMLSNPHVTWRDDRASIRYGRAGGIQSGSYWDVGVRKDGSFSFSLEGPNDQKLTIAKNGNISIEGEIVSKGINVEYDRTTHIEKDGALYRYNGQVYISIDDNLYIRDYSRNKYIHLDVLNQKINYSSDIKLKKNIQPLENGLQKILSLRGVTFEWKDDESCQQAHKQLGLIAQEVESIFPEIVQIGHDGIRSIHYIGLITPMIEAIKEQQKQISSLLMRLEEQQNNNVKLKN